MAEDRLSRWLLEFKRYLLLKKMFLLYGNIYDQLWYPVQGPEQVNWTYFSLRELLVRFLKDQKYQVVVFYDLVDGITFSTEEDREMFIRISQGRESGFQPDTAISLRGNDSHRPYAGSGKADQGTLHVGSRSILHDFDAALDSIRRVVADKSVSAAMVIDYSSRLITSSERLIQREREQFIKLMKCVQEAARVNIAGEVLNNVIILVCDKLNDLPPWLYLNNPLVKTIQISLPGQSERKRYFNMVAGAFYGAEKQDRIEKTIEEMTDLTHGMCNYELECLRLLSIKEKISIIHPKKIIQSYKFGIVESAWEKLKGDDGVSRLLKSEEILKKRVKGQEAAIRAVMDIIKRAAVGLSGIQHSSSAHKPRGILFFAGPTGVGKTEMAKALAEALFGDEDACIRFDMSEYAQEHADQRLLGAPPGYIGYEEGGQLTNKVKESPFSVLLFDEIEKAHPRIMDKFLQILEDGRITDGKGETVYFSESIIIFTSNIGSYAEIPAGGGMIVRKPNILPYSWRCGNCGAYLIEEESPLSCQCGKFSFEKVETPYVLLKEKIMGALEDHFKFSLGRPEIYNRIGNNFIIFDYIRVEVTEEIINKILDAIYGEIAEKKKIHIDFSQAVREFLKQRATGNLDQGGRGIGNMIETVLVNPLARVIFDLNIGNAGLMVKKIIENVQGGAVSYELETKILEKTILESGTL